MTAIRGREPARRLLAGLLATLLAAACMPIEIIGGAARPEAAVGTRADPRASADRQLAEAHRQLGVGLEEAGDIDGAVDELLASLTLDRWPENPASGGADANPYNDLARICGRRDPADQVVRACARVIASFRFASGRLAEFLANRGDAYLQLAEPVRALADYQTALKVETSNPRGLFGRARIRAQAGDHLAALPDFKRAIAGGLDQPETRYARALSSAAVGDFEAVIDDLDHVLAEPEGLAAYPDAYRDRAVAHCRTGQADAAAVGWQVWLSAAGNGANYVQDMLWAHGYLRGPKLHGPGGADFGPAELAALRAWTKAGCPED